MFILKVVFLWNVQLGGTVAQNISKDRWNVFIPSLYVDCPHLQINDFPKVKYKFKLISAVEGRQLSWCMVIWWVISGLKREIFVLQDRRWAIVTKYMGWTTACYTFKPSENIQGMYDIFVNIMYVGVMDPRGWGYNYWSL